MATKNVDDDQIFLVNKKTGEKFVLNGFIPSDEPPETTKFSATFAMEHKVLPAAVDLTDWMTPVEHQLHLKCCTGNALAGAIEFFIKKNVGLHIDVSRLFIYYNARRNEGLQTWNMSDRGCTIRGAVAGLAQYGCCKESLFEYEPSNVNKTPTAECFAQAKNHRLVAAEPMTADVNTMKACLAEGFPFAFGLQTFESFAQAETNGGKVPLPLEGETMSSDHGWHAMLAAGYSDALQAFIVRNSWGPTWGDKGYCYIPYEYMGNSQYCKDIHAIKEVLIQGIDTSYVNGDKKSHPCMSTPNHSNHKDCRQFWKDKSHFPNLFSIFSGAIKSSHQKQGSATIERVSKKDRLSKKFYILWIDEPSAENTLLAQKIEEKGNLEVEFSGTYANGERYLFARKAKIQESMRFLIICRGYFRNENKNPLNLLKFLDQNHLASYSVIVFTRDKDGLSKTLDEQAAGMDLYGWRRRVHVTNEVEDLMSKIDYHLKN